MSDDQQPTAADLSAAFGAFLAALRAFRAQFLIEGTDYGVIPNTGRDAKPTLLKPGSEKIAKWLGLRPHFVADLDTWAMGGSLPGLICYRCQLIDPQGEIAGEGQGSAHVDEGHLKYSKEKQQNGESRPWTVNNAIKYAQKRAQVDAILRYGCLSAEFTQDLEDQEQAADAAYAAQQQRSAARPPASRPAQNGAATTSLSPAADSLSPASADPDGLPDGAAARPLQLRQIRALLPLAGLTEAEVCKGANVARLEDLTAVRAQAGIEKLQAATRGRRKGATA